MTSSPRSKAKRVVAAIYSRSADKLYDRVVLKASLPLLARGLNEEALAQGRRAAASAKGGPILDMPVGTGHFTRAITRQHAGIVVACDIAQGMVETARNRAAAEGIGNLAVVQADAHRLPFRSGAFPVVISTNGLQVIPGTEEAIAELVRVTATGGNLFVAGVASRAARWFREHARHKLPGFLRDPAEIVEIFRDAGAEMGAVRRHGLGYSMEGRRFTR